MAQNAVSTDNLKSMPKNAENAMSDAKDFVANQGMDFIKSNYEDLRSQAKSAMKGSESLIKSNPFYAVLGALGVGIVIGAVLRGSSK